MNDEQRKFNAFLRDRYLPDPKDMAAMAIKDYQDKHGRIKPDELKKKFSEVLTESILIEKEKFLGISRHIESVWVEEILKDKKAQSAFPGIYKKVSEAQQILTEKTSDGEKLAKAFSLLSGISSDISFGMKQSAKTRVGQSLENHLSFLFKELGMKFVMQKTKAEKDGEIFDFIFPSLKYAEENPQDSILVESQSTLKDRFRLSLGKGQSLSSITKYVATATGANLIRKDIGDITPNKRKEIREKQWKLIVLKQVSDGLKDSSVISFEDFVQKYYPAKSQLW